MVKQVREPIQVYLSSEERAELERAARDLGVSRSEALRRGIEALGTRPLPGGLRDVASAGLVTPAAIGPGEPPPSKPVATLTELLCELEEDRRDL
jgi:hypothetical protein